MNNIVNFQQKMEQEIDKIQGDIQPPSLLLHSCCAPCSSYVLENLSQYFLITVYYYNPNISEEEEYVKRVNEQKRFISELKTKNQVKFVDAPYNTYEFYDAVKGLEEEKEGGKRCYVCYELRMKAACIYAKENKYDYFTTTLSISPYKNAKWLNEIGESLGKEYDINYLYADFKKKNGYKRSIELSKEYGLYRQDYCGCIYSKVEATR